MCCDVPMIDVGQGLAPFLVLELWSAVALSRRLALDLVVRDCLLDRHCLLLPLLPRGARLLGELCPEVRRGPLD